MFEKILLNVQNNKNSYDLNIQTISERVDLAASGPKKKSRKCFFGLRHVVTLVGFFNCFFLNVHTVVISVSIVAMVKHGPDKESSNWNKSEISCPMASKPPKLLVGTNFQGEFDWSTELQGYVLGVSSLSYLITLIPAGRLADSAGSKSLMVFSNAVTGILTLISPFAARWRVYDLITIQFLRGASQGFTTPTIHKSLSNWIPRHERGTLSTLVVCGYAAGAAVTGIVTGWLCDIPGLGWPSAFYVWGIINVLLSVMFHFIFYEYPENHPWITDEELNYISNGLEIKTAKKQSPTPWKKMLSSVPTYAYCYGLFGHYWSIGYFLTVHPTFMGTVLHYPMFQNGVTSCLPVLLKGVGGVFASIISYWISKKNLIGLNKLRKTTTVFGAFGFSLCMVGILLAGCDAIINILCFSLSLFSSGIALSGIMISGVDMAPAFAGSLMGVASTVAGSAFFIIPVITGFITAHETLSEWQIVFWVNLVVVGSSGLVYVLFGSAEVQHWNYSESEHSVEVADEAKKQADKSVNETVEMSEKLYMSTK